jgi:hypothetical protein
MFKVPGIWPSFHQANFLRQGIDKDDGIIIKAGRHFIMIRDQFRAGIGDKLFHWAGNGFERQRPALSGPGAKPPSRIAARSKPTQRSIYRMRMTQAAKFMS